MEALLAEIARARHHIHIQYYILNDDQTGCRLRDALVAKAREGVRVRILYDDVGSRGAKELLFKGMRDAGIEVYAFLHVKFPLFTSKVNYRNHRKIVVIDGRVGFIGGMNIADRYVRGTQWGTWRDTHFRIEGSGAAGLQASFLSDWSATTKTHISGPDYYPPAGHFTDDILQIAPSGPFGKWRALLQADSYAIARARQRIWIQTPYYLPSDVLNTALHEAALAGIDVHLMLPARSDSKVVDLATHSYLDDMMKAGGENLVLQTGVPALQTADYRRHALGDRLGEHGFPQLRAQFRDQRLRLRPRIRKPHGRHIRRRPDPLPHRHPGRMVHPPAHPPRRGIAYARLFAAAVNFRRGRRLFVSSGLQFPLQFGHDLLSQRRTGGHALLHDRGSHRPPCA